jgi:hypothetical protein
MVFCIGIVCIRYDLFADFTSVFWWYILAGEENRNEK